MGTGYLCRVLTCPIGLCWALEAAGKLYRALADLGELCRALMSFSEL
jgi:hypothetical protein